jgi:hypothetical protein
MPAASDDTIMLEIPAWGSISSALRSQRRHEKYLSAVRHVPPIPPFTIDGKHAGNLWR